MKAISYYAALPFLYTLSMFPLGLLYFFSDGLYYFLYHITGYRRKIVFTNLQNSFPGKNNDEIKIIAKKFHRNLSDLIVEDIKLLTISKNELAKRCSYHNMTLFDQYFSSGKSVIIVMGHLGNWEWAGVSMSASSTYKPFVIYRKLSNTYFDKFFYNLRSRLGAIPIETKDTFRTMIKNKSQLTMTAFIADQTPSPESALWVKFMNQDTPVFQGTEVIARRLNYPVVYASVKKIKRGFYKVYVETLIEEPALTKEGEITMMHTKRLEKDIHENPVTWLWSHRRWKHKKPAGI